MDTWTPLFSSIIRSSIWGAEKHVRIVWVTILAMKDKEGFVDASLPGLARMAAVTIEECEDAIRVLESPDPHSHNPENEGRRIQKEDGGWLVLSHKRYQKKMKEVSDKINAALRQRRLRERIKQQQAHPIIGETIAQKILDSGGTQEDVDRFQASTLPDERNGE